jgi:hypothetical protein
MPLKTILRTYIRAGKLCPDFFFHEPLAGLYAGEKEAKSRVRCFFLCAEAEHPPCGRLLFL